MDYKIKEIMAIRGIGNKELSELTGIPIGTLNKIIYGDTKKPTLDNMQSIASALGCTLDDFIGSSKRSMTNDELKLIQTYRSINDEGQEVLMDYAVFLMAQDKYKKSNQPELVEENA